MRLDITFSSSVQPIKETGDSKMGLVALWGMVWLVDGFEVGVDGWLEGGIAVEVIIGESIGACRVVDLLDLRVAGFLL